jgi:hypothetical protein
VNKEEAIARVNELADFSIIDYQRKYHVGVGVAMQKREELRQAIIAALTVDTDSDCSIARFSRRFAKLPRLTTEELVAETQNHKDATDLG